MNEDYINKWNQTVKPSDKIFHLGDFALTASITSIRNLISLLNGYKILIKGNHDRFNTKFAVENLGFNECYQILNFEGYILAHRPNYDTTTKQLCGHVHEKWKKKDLLLNVGVDVWNGYPVSFDEVKHDNF
jgi:calcineurin-like phosphoesterase family protein